MVRRLFTFVSCRSGANFQLRVIFNHHSQDQGRHYFPSSYTSRLGPNFSLGLVLHATTSIISQRAFLCYDIHPRPVLEFTTSAVYLPFGPFFALGSRLRSLHMKSYEICASTFPARRSSMARSIPGTSACGSELTVRCRRAGRLRSGLHDDGASSHTSPRQRGRPCEMASRCIVACEKPLNLP